MNFGKRSRSSPPKNRQSSFSQQEQRQQFPSTNLPIYSNDANLNSASHDNLPSTTSDATSTALTQLAALTSSLTTLQASFTPPSSLSFQPPNPASPTTQPKLAFTPNNAPLLAHEDALVKLLTKIDAVESGGDPAVRKERKELVRKVDQELERVDTLKRDAWERQLSGVGTVGAKVIQESDQEAMLREKRERVDRMLKNVGVSQTPAAPPPAQGRQLESSSPSTSQERERKQPRYASPTPGPPPVDSYQTIPPSLPPRPPQGLPTSPSAFRPTTRSAPQNPPPTTSSLPPPIQPPSPAMTTRRNVAQSSDKPYFSNLPSRFG